MGRRAKPTKEVRPNSYRVVWAGDPFTRNRVEVIRRTGQDFFPGSSSSAILETAFEGLVDGRPIKEVPDVEYLIPQVRAAIEQLFRMRDAGELGA